jgi:HEAT repeat protein
MQEENQLSFAEILELLFASESVPIQHLYRLSDMEEQESHDFRQHWSSAADDRRHEIARHMADLSEDNFVVDFAPVFSSMLVDGHGPVRIAALDGLWDCEDEDLVDPIINLLLEDPLVEVKAAAARSLAHFLLMAEWGQVSGRKVSVIFEALQKVYEEPDSALAIKAAALEAMGPLTHPKVSEYIAESYEGAWPELQRSALFAMGTSADPKWLPLLIDEMESPYADFRAEAARAAGSIGSSESISQLSELVHDEDEDVARAAIIALGQIGGQQANRVLEDLISDDDYIHLHDTVEEGLEDSMWADGEFQLFKWSAQNSEDNADSMNNGGYF